MSKITLNDHIGMLLLAWLPSMAIVLDRMPKNIAPYFIGEEADAKR